MDDAIQFLGRFQWWEYSVGHACLLLRSAKSAARPTRVDILFKNVAAVELPTVFDDPTVTRVATNAAEVGGRLGALELSGRGVYSITGPHVQGLVIAGTMVWHEDDGEYDEPSRLP